MWASKTRNREPGFTIVELLIVIVVIVILAAITIVAFNGIQTRSKNANTVSLVSTYAKALQLYKADNGGNLPGDISCLGTGYAGGRCRSDTSPVYAEDGNGFNSVHLNKYLPTVPKATPTIVWLNASLSLAGAWYNYNDASYNPSGGGMGVIILGSGPCPAIGGVSYLNNAATSDGNLLCRYKID